MERNFPRCDSELEVARCADLLRESDLDLVVVQNAAGHVEGLVTLRDFVERVLLPERAGTIAVSTVMTRVPVITCSPDDELQNARDQMDVAQKAHILVVDGAGVCLGVIRKLDADQVMDEIGPARRGRRDAGVV